MPHHHPEPYSPDIEKEIEASNFDRLRRHRPRAAGHLTGHTVTEFGQFLATPEYMSPELASRDEREIGPASDVYSLGVLLYELLTGAMSNVIHAAAWLLIVECSKSGCDSGERNAGWQWRTWGPAHLVRLLSARNSVFEFHKRPNCCSSENDA